MSNSLIGWSVEKKLSIQYQYVAISEMLLTKHSILTVERDDSPWDEYASKVSISIEAQFEDVEQRLILLH